MSFDEIMDMEWANTRLLMADKLHYVGKEGKGKGKEIIVMDCKTKEEEYKSLTAIMD